MKIAGYHVSRLAHGGATARYLGKALFATLAMWGPLLAEIWGAKPLICAAYGIAAVFLDLRDIIGYVECLICRIRSSDAHQKTLQFQ